MSENADRLPLRFRYRVDGSDLWFFGCLFPGTEYAGTWWCVVFARVGGGVESVKTDESDATQEVVGASEFEWIDTESGR